MHLGGQLRQLGSPTCQQRPVSCVPGEACGTSADTTCPQRRAAAHLSHRVAGAMDGYRTPQETAALRDVAYVIRFGHFPEEEQVKGGVAATTTEIPGISPLPKDGDTPKKGSENEKSPARGGDRNPFGDDDDFYNDETKALNEDYYSEELNPFKDDGNPFTEDDAPPEGDKSPSNDTASPAAEGANPFSEDSISTQEGQDTAGQQSQGTPKPAASSSVPPQPPASRLKPYSPAPHQHVELTRVSRELVKEVVTELFKVTQLDLRCLMEDVSRNRETPKVQLLLEELRAEGLGLQPTTGSCSPPLVFLRAAVGESSSFTTFTSTSATRATKESLTMEVKNMYTETLLLQLWSVPVAEEVELTAAAPMMDKLTRLIKHAKDRTNNTSLNKFQRETAPADNVMQAEEKTKEAKENKSDNSNDIPSISISKSAPPPEDSTETLPAEEDSGEDNENRTPDRKSPSKSETSNTSNDQTPLDSTITAGAEREVMASTPKSTSASTQDLELSHLGTEGNKKPLTKSQSSMGSLKKIPGHSLRASFRANFRKKKHNGSAVSIDQQSEKSFDTASMASQNSFANPFEEDRGSNTGQWHDDEDGGCNGNKLNREMSRSTLSVTSFSRLNRSLRLSSKKASQVLRRIGSVKGKGTRSETNTPEPTRRHQYLPPSANTSPITPPKSTEDDDDARPIHSTPVSSTPRENSLEFTPTKKKSIRSMFKPRALRTFSSLGDSSAKGLAQLGEKEDTIDEGEASNSIHSQRAPQNPKEIQGCMKELGKAHLKAELVAYASIPIKSLVGKWKKEGWLPLTLVQKESLMTPKKKKTVRADTDLRRDKAGCRFHVRLTLPSLDTELGPTGYETYYTAFRKLVHAYISTVPGNLSEYNAEVSPVGNVLLQQLVFFSRVGEPQKSLAKWLVMTEVKPGDPGILHPLLQAIKTHLEAGIYLTTQKRQLGIALVTWVRKVLSDEFEMLHSSFPRREGLLELARLENFLRCFNTVENCYELRVLFEREAATQDHTAVTDLLQKVLVKHADNWVEALSKEKLQQDTGDASPTTPKTTSEDSAWALWQDSLRRASLLTKPILDFLTISFHTYQPIFTQEIRVDYLYLVMPKMLKAAAHLLNPLIKFDADGTAHHVTAKAIAVAAQATWVLIINLSSINKIGISSRLPHHLILKTYQDAFCEVLHHWLVLSKHLALEEFQKDILEDQFEAVDPSQGHSLSAVGVADLMKAIMKRLCSIEWPGGVGPRATTLQTMGQQMMELAAQYADKVTHAYISIATQSNNIPTEVCVVVRNVEHVCHEVRKHLLHLAEMAKETPEVVQQLQDRTTHLQEHIEDAAEALLRQCLPNLEKAVTRGVREDNSEHVIKTLEEAIQPVADRLYFAEPLLHQLWYRLVDHVEQLKIFFVQGDNRDDLRQLKVVQERCHDFLTDPDGIALSLPEEVTKNYKSMQAELNLLGATSPELISQFYQTRYQEQQRENSNSEKVFVFNAMFTKNGLRVHVVQAPGVTSASSLVKVRVEPFQWFPTAEPLKTSLAKGDPAVFDEVLEFPVVQEDSKEGEGVLTLQVRSPRLLSSSIVHGEIVLPLAELPSVSESEVFGVPHQRLPTTRPWDFKSYKPLAALMTRTQDKVAMEFLKTLTERWKSGEGSELISDNPKLSSFVRGGSVRNIKAAGKKHQRKGTIVK